MRLHREGGVEERIDEVAEGESLAGDERLKSGRRAMAALAALL